MAKIIFGLVGPLAGGKDTVKKYLADKYKSENCRFSTILRDILKRIDVPIEREKLQQLSTILRQNFGEDVLAKVIATDVTNMKSDIVVVDGVRLGSGNGSVGADVVAQIFYIPPGEEE